MLDQFKVSPRTSLTVFFFFPSQSYIVEQIDGRSLPKEGMYICTIYSRYQYGGGEVWLRKSGSVPPPSVITMKIVKAKL